MSKSSPIDKIFYINLDTRKDRRENMEKNFKEYGLEAERFPGIVKIRGIIGCGYSHLGVLKLAKKRGYRNVLIFEDDFMFCVSKEQFHNTVELLFEQFPNFDVLFLSYSSDCIEKYKELPEDKIANQLLEGTNASGYIVASHYFEKLIDLYEENLPKLEETFFHWIYANDQIWKNLSRVDNWYYPKSPIGHQIPGGFKSDCSSEENKISFADLTNKKENERKKTLLL